MALMFLCSCHPAASCTLYRRYSWLRGSSIISILFYLTFCVIRDVFPRLDGVPDAEDMLQMKLCTKSQVVLPMLNVYY